MGSVLSSDRTRGAWETALVELGISRYNPPFAVLSDGDQAIEAAVATTLPGVRMQRCTWHLKHNATNWIAERYPSVEDEGQRRGLMAAVHVIVDAPDLNPSASSRLRPFARPTAGLLPASSTAFPASPQPTLLTL